MADEREDNSLRPTSALANFEDMPMNAIFSSSSSIVLSFLPPALLWMLYSRTRRAYPIVQLPGCVHNLYSRGKGKQTELRMRVAVVGGGISGESSFHEAIQVSRSDVLV